jgi:SAM-dependent methyltransferase
MYGLSFPQPILESNFAFDTLITYKCNKCGTESYHPNIIGDSSFYDYLSSNLNWYYPKARWEFQIALEILDKEKPRLFVEVGCGNGHFLEQARNRGHEGYGNEINPHSVEVLRSQGFQVVTDLEENLHQYEYDALVMFQLLEHLLDPFSSLKSIIAHVRSQGVVITSTPVTPSCCASIASPSLLLPPHHQWLPTTLGHKILADRLGLVCERIVYDPPDPYQIEYGLRKRLGSVPYMDRYIKRLAQLTLRIARVMHYDWAGVGHTILVILRKV